MMTAVIWCCVFNLDWVMSVICIYWDIIGNVFYSTCTNVLLFLSRFLRF